MRLKEPEAVLGRVLEIRRVAVLLRAGAVVQQKEAGRQHVLAHVVVLVQQLREVREERVEDR